MRKVKETGFRLWLSLTLEQQLKEELEAEDVRLHRVHCYEFLISVEVCWESLESEHFD